MTAIKNPDGTIRYASLADDPNFKEDSTPTEGERIVRAAREFAGHLFASQDADRRRGLMLKILRVIPGQSVPIPWLENQIDEDGTIVWGACEALAEMFAVRRGITSAGICYARGREAAHVIGRFDRDMRQEAAEAREAIVRAKEAEQAADQRVNILANMPATVADLAKVLRRKPSGIAEQLERMRAEGLVRVDPESGEWRST